MNEPTIRVFPVSTFYLDVSPETPAIDNPTLSDDGATSQKAAVSQFRGRTVFVLDAGKWVQARVETWEEEAKRLRVALDEHVRSVERQLAQKALDKANNISRVRHDLAKLASTMFELADALNTDKLEPLVDSLIASGRNLGEVHDWLLSLCTNRRKS